MGATQEVIAHSLGIRRTTVTLIAQQLLLTARTIGAVTPRPAERRVDRDA
jgi:hypothetical protein